MFLLSERVSCQSRAECARRVALDLGVDVCCASTFVKRPPEIVMRKADGQGRRFGSGKARRQGVFW